MSQFHLRSSFSSHTPLASPGYGGFRTGFARGVLSLILSLGLIQDAHADEAVTLDAVIQLAEQRSDTLRAVEQSIASLEAEIRSRERELSPILTAEAGAVRDERERSSSSSDNPSADRAPAGRYGFYDVEVAKPFDTGTALALRGGHDIRARGNQLNERDVADWELRLSQSLWRNSFGRATDLRRASEVFELKSRRLAALSERQRLLERIELAFWDLVLAHKEVAIHQANLDRSIVLETWTRERQTRYAAEDVDLLQVQSLLSERRLNLISTRSAVENAGSRLRELIPQIDPKTWRVDVSSLDRGRDLAALLLNASVPATAKAPIRIDAMESSYRAEQFRIAAARVSDDLDPLLDAYVSYGANGYDKDFAGSWAESMTEDSSNARMGLVLSVELDAGLKNERRISAERSADAQQSRARALRLESEVAWQELRREVQSLEQQIAEARKFSTLQSKKVAAERERFEQGRSTTFQLTTFEVDAGNSQIVLQRLLAALRKTESRARAFTAEEDSLS